ncbi:MAG: 50S ribosomal protein L19 [Verrucomicrobiota bacterium]
MNTKIFEKINQEQLKKEGLPVFRVGDTVRVHVKIKEGDKERIQVYAGTVIARRGAGATETFTVRRISYGEGVERVFPIHGPSVAKVEVEKSGKVRRAKLFYLRTRTGKTSRIEEQGKPEAPKAP